MGLTTCSDAARCRADTDNLAVALVQVSGAFDDRVFPDDGNMCKT
jgi:hypothetical protein